MKKNAHAFANQLFVCLLVTIFCGGSIGLGTVWMRHQISVTANANRVLAARLAEFERHIAETKTLIERAQRPDELRRLNADFRLGLAPVSEAQVMHVTEDPVRRLAARANRDLFGELPAPVTLTIALQR
jgi:hypothetical protein